MKTKYEQLCEQMDRQIYPHKSKAPKTHCVYKFTCLINRKIYIGRSGNLGARMMAHKKSGHSDAKTRFARDIYRHGWENFSFEVIRANLHLYPSQVLERFHIQLNPDNYNDSLGDPIELKHVEWIMINVPPYINSLRELKCSLLDLMDIGYEE